MIKTTRLRQLRLKYHIKLTELAAVSSISNQRLSEYERGERNAAYATRNRIADAFLHLAEKRRDSYQSLCNELNGGTSDLLTTVEVASDES